MDRKIIHNKVGKMNVLIEHQRTETNYGIGLPKYVALATSLNTAHASRDWRDDAITFKHKYNNGKLIETYYLIWGPSDQLEYNGFTELRTPSGRKMSLGAALKQFQEAIKATEFLEFRKVYKGV
jgi:hypothetical protein